MSKAKMENAALPKRFYKRVALDPVNSGFSITLDGKPVKTPGKQMLQHASAEIAAAIAAEWDAQVEVINPDRMPLTRLAHIAIDRVPLDRKELLQDIAQYAGTDLLFYRAPVAEAAHPLQADNAVLRQRQDAAFDPVLAWVEQQFHVRFVVTEGVLPVAQDAAAISTITATFAAATDGELAALAMMVPLLGSALVALAVWKQHLGVEEALAMVRLDENVQAERWGMDAHVAQAWQVKANDIRACAFFLTAK